MTDNEFNIDAAVAVLERTPASLAALLEGLPDAWISATEGVDTWSAYDVIGHLIHGELTDWIPRAQHILAGKSWPFDKFDRTAQFRDSTGQSLTDLLVEFARLRRENIAALEKMNLTRSDLDRRGLHPELGEVTLAQLLATWVVHDLDHVAQVARVMAKSYATAVGPWTAYLSILHDRNPKEDKNQ